VLIVNIIQIQIAWIAYLTQYHLNPPSTHTRPSISLTTSSQESKSAYPACLSFLTVTALPRMCVVVLGLVRSLSPPIGLHWVSIKFGTIVDCCVQLTWVLKFCEQQPVCAPSPSLPTRQLSHYHILCTTRTLIFMLIGQCYAPTPKPQHASLLQLNHYLHPRRSVGWTL